MAENAKKAANAPQQDLNQLRKVRREKLAELVAAGKNPYEIVTYDQTEHTQDIKDNYEAYEGKDVSIAGRLMAKRVMGKASFANVQDLKGNIQIYITRDDLGEEAYKEFKKFDVGDIVGVKGFVFTTQKGERSIHAKEITLLSKSLQILPEKFHGLTNTDLRYRQRYVDLIMNPESKDVFVKRSRIISAIRRYLDERGIHYEKHHKVGDILNLFFDEYVEEHLIQPTFLTGHPIEISPLTKKNPENPGKVLRFEMFMNGWEMCNAYSELNDPIDQRERFAAQEEAFAAGDEEANHTDEDFLNALEIGMPPTGGIGYGIDRMVMLFTGAEAIRDVLLFPTMKTLEK